MERPNGVLVSGDDRYLYVADNNNNTRGGARKLWRFNLLKDGAVDVATKKLVYDWAGGRGPDGHEVAPHQAGPRGQPSRDGLRDA